MSKIGFKDLCVSFSVAAFLCCTAGSVFAANKVEDSEITIIHVGDIHGHLEPHINVRSDSNGLLEGGVARVYTTVDNIRKRNPDNILVMTGDTVHGSAEAMFTEGQVMIDVLNKFGVEVFAPGNWEFVYGTERFLEMFAGANPLADWGSIGSNLYYDGAPYADKVGQNVLPQYIIKMIGGKKVGFIGFTTERGPKVIGSEVVQGFSFTKGDDELAALIPVMRNELKVDLLVMMSELGMANNIRLTEKFPGVDIVLSSDMHEETPHEVINNVGTVLVAQGMDGANVGEIRVHFKNGGIEEISYKQFAVDSRTTENPEIAAMVGDILATFNTGPGFVEHTNPINGKVLTTPLDTVVGTAQIDLHRTSYSHQKHPAVVEGSSHRFLAEAYREMTGADLGVIRGFRYGTTIPAGEITLGDIYHYMPIGPGIAKGEVSGQQVMNILENSADGSLKPDVRNWSGGWLFGWSGLKFDLDAYQAKGLRITNVTVFDRVSKAWAPLDLTKTYTMAGYNYASEPGLINKAAAKNVVPLLDDDGTRKDGVQVVVDYLKTHDANPVETTVKLLQPLPNYEDILGFPVIQMFYGARVSDKPTN